jgi:hypothetical protein
MALVLVLLLLMLEILTWTATKVSNEVTKYGFRDCYHCHPCLSHYLLTVQCLSLTMFTHISALDNICGGKYKALRKPIPHPCTCTCTYNIDIDQLRFLYDYKHSAKMLMVTN